MNHVGPPPKLVKNEDFASWVYLFKRHLNHSSTNLWRIIEQGFYPHDPSNFTPREAADHQFNESALFILQEAIPLEDIAHLRPFTPWKISRSLCFYVDNESIPLKILFISISKSSSHTSTNPCFPLRRAYLFTFMLSHHPLIKKHQLESTAVICIHYY